MACMIPEYRKFAAKHAGECRTEQEMEAAFAKHIGAQFYHHQGDKMEFVVWQRPSLEAVCYLTGRGRHQLVEDILSGKFNHIMYPSVLPDAAGVTTN